MTDTRKRFATGVPSSLGMVFAIIAGPAAASLGAPFWLAILIVLVVGGVAYLVDINWTRGDRTALPPRAGRWVQKQGDTAVRMQSYPGTMDERSSSPEPDTEQPPTGSAAG